MVDVVAHRHQKAIERMQQLAQLQTQPQTFQEAPAKSQEAAQSTTETIVRQGAHPMPQADMQAQSQAETSVDVLRQRARSGTKKVRMEDVRRRQTYWLTDDDIRMVEELASATGMNKYQVVSIAIRELYRQVMTE